MKHEETKGEKYFLLRTDSFPLLHELFQVATPHGRPGGTYPVHAVRVSPSGSPHGRHVSLPPPSAMGALKGGGRFVIVEITILSGRERKTRHWKRKKNLERGLLFSPSTPPFPLSSTLLRDDFCRSSCWFLQEPGGGCGSARGLPAPLLIPLSHHSHRSLKELTPTRLSE